MTNLYTNKLSRTYDNMYQGFIDYTLEYNFYAGICSRYKSSTILEIACGTGNLAKPFSQNFNSYTGLDISDSMLDIAKKRYPIGIFIKGDMRSFKSTTLYDSILITGRSTSYLISEKDILTTLDAIANSLEKSGVFIFDFIDADRFVPYVDKHKYVTHKSEYNEKQYFRKSEWVNKKVTNINLIHWKADYYQIKQGENVFIGNDTSTFRCFSKIEIGQLLSKKGFKILDLIDRKTYAFDTYVAVCKKL